MGESPAAAAEAARAQVRLDAGDRAGAIAASRRALAIDPDCLAAHVCMAHAKLPGEDFLGYLRRFHGALRPRTYLEIGVDAGRTLSLARPPTVAIGVDPAAKGEGIPFAAETKLFALESDVFFAMHDVEAEFGHAIDLAFVDGLHLFEQALRDFLHVERHAAPESVVLFHDCLPLDAATATRARQTGFWTGDVWKIVPILQRLRPDLDVFVIPTYPTGLAVVTRLDPGSRVLEERFAAIVEEWVPRTWKDAPEGASPEFRLPLVPNDWEAVLSRVRPSR
ncbi:MAG TPA: class I SAM-dependent methyltransferase [Thermoanaerobaculia bacterium]